VVNLNQSGGGEDVAFRRQQIKGGSLISSNQIISPETISSTRQSRSRSYASVLIRGKGAGEKRDGFIHIHISLCVFMNENE